MVGATTMQGRTWLDECARLLRLRAPEVSRRDARTCAEEMHRLWPDLAPAQAVGRYFEQPQFEQTDWSIFELK